MKKLMKIVGVAVGGYAILNTLFWAVIGTGRYLNDIYTDNRLEKVINFGNGNDWWGFLMSKLDVCTDLGTKGWKTWLHRTFSI